MVTGLAYNSIGGGILFIEATQASFNRENPERKTGGKGMLKVTGSLGEVMKESSQISQSYAKAFLYRNFCESHPNAVDFLEQ